MSFKLTKEQQDIISTATDNNKVIKINAYAGSGKTSSLIELVKEIRKKDKDCKILYLVFNRGMVQDSKIKFDSLDLGVDCFTTHSFALRRFMAIKDGEVEVMPNIDYSEYIKVKGKKNKYKYSKYKNVLDMFNEYCLTFDNLDTFCENMITGKNYYNLRDSGIRSYEIEFFKDLYTHFIKAGKYMHNMYLKEYSCNCKDKIRGYKYVLLDEAQDLNPFMLNIINRTTYDKMWVVGDIYQQIYKFNRAVNSMERYDGLTLPLSTSFRFSNDICNLANEVLASKYKDFKLGAIKNIHNNTEVSNTAEKTILFRKNSTMFEYAVNLVKEMDNIKVMFMDTGNGGNCDGFDETFSDMLYFYDRLLQSKEGAQEILEEFRSKFRVKSSKVINGYVKIAEKEGSGLYSYLCYNKSILSLDLLKMFHFFLSNERDIVNVLEKVRASEDNSDPSKTYTLITAHRSKGLEWSHVKIAEDAWSLNSDDEANLVYVACTRAKNKLDARPILALLEQKNMIK